MVEGRSKHADWFRVRFGGAQKCTQVQLRKMRKVLQEELIYRVVAPSDTRNNVRTGMLNAGAVVTRAHSQFSGICT